MDTSAAISTAEIVPTLPTANDSLLSASESDSDSDDEGASTREFLVQARVRQFVKSYKNGYPGATWTKLDTVFGDLSIFDVEI